MLTKEEVKHIASLSRIGVSEEEVEKFSKDLNAVLDWIKQLEEVNIENVSPTAHSIGMENITNEDIVEEFSAREEIIKLFPEERDRYDKVKSVL
jgi:aspartyl-tRNA(Asn)/glutamyl-tRNA(Gln) amidotransferase subunit C